MTTERAGENLSRVLHAFSGGLLLEETGLIPVLAQEGLYAICMCQHGIGRSFGAAEILTTHLKKPSVFIEGGLEGFAQLDENQKEKAIRALSSAPRLFMFLDDYEMRRYREEIEQIGSAMKAGLKVVPPPYSIVEKCLD